jgi:hypothetical protein
VSEPTKAPAKKTIPRRAAPKKPGPEHNPADVVEVTGTPDTGQTWPTNAMSRPYPNVHELWSRVMESVRSVAKGDFNEDQGFKFRGVDAVVDAVGPALRQHKVHIRPHKVRLISTTEYTTKRGARMVNRVVKVKWKVTGPQGDSFVGESVGEAADAGDKSLSKAQSVAYRMYLLQALAIPTGERDPDADAHERDTPAAGEGYYWNQQQERQYSRQRSSQGQQYPSQADYDKDVRGHLPPVGEENHDIEEARKQMWKTCKGLGWQWNPLAARFQADHGGRETSQATTEELEAFTAELVREAEEEEDRAKKAAADVLGAKQIEGGVL